MIELLFISQGARASHPRLLLPDQCSLRAVSIHLSHVGAGGEHAEHQREEHDQYNDKNREGEDQGDSTEDSDTLQTLPIGMQHSGDIRQKGIEDAIVRNDAFSIEVVQ